MRITHTTRSHPTLPQWEMGIMVEVGRVLMEVDPSTELFLLPHPPTVARRLKARFSFSIEPIGLNNIWKRNRNGQR
jgi:hypothetical protein